MEESKHDKFKRVATKRVNDIISKIDTLSNCSNKSAYEYTDEDISKIFKAIETKLKESKLIFKPAKKSEFKL
jgi:hypothetical protein